MSTRKMNALYKFQRENFQPKDILKGDFPLQAYPETANGTMLHRMARTLEFKIGIKDSDALIRGKIIGALAASEKEECGCACHDGDVWHSKKCCPDCGPSLTNDVEN